MATAEEEVSEVAHASDEESNLTECVASAVPRKRLTWHYRSQDESLIAFSNRHYYDDKLSSFPAPETGAGDIGVHLVRVDGHFNRSGRGRELRTNRVEAEAIVADIAERFRRSPDVAPSLGVVTFNAQQRELIDNLLRDLGDERVVAALDEPDGLFVKNLENVQGDERDTILFSVAFSKNQTGKLPGHFGPLNLPGGERRFNVAITRARRQIVMYCSFDPAEIPATTTVNVSHLRAYLQLAAASEPLGASLRTASRDAHREDIAAALRERGLDVSTDIGLSDFRLDLTVGRADSPHQVAVMLDGEAWANRRTVADRDDLPARFLTGSMGWRRVLRIWLPRWLDDRDRVVAEVERAVEEVRQAVDAAPEQQEMAPRRTDDVEPSRSEPPAETPPPEPAVRGIPHPQEPSRTAPVRPGGGYVATPEPPVTGPGSPDVTVLQEWQPDRAGTTSALDALPEHWAREMVREVLLSGIAAEGPIHRERLARVTAAAFGLNRVAAARSDAILGCLPRGVTVTERAFLWPSGVEPSTWWSVRTSETLVRGVEHISLIELSNALRVVAERLGGADGEELMRGALALFGGRRLTAGIGQRMEQALAEATRNGRLVATAHGYQAAPR